MTNDLSNSRERGSSETPKLDQAKLFGFRNLAPVTKSGSAMQEAAELAFNKRGGPDSENPTEL